MPVHARRSAASIPPEYNLPRRADVAADAVRPILDISEAGLPFPRGSQTPPLTNHPAPSRRRRRAANRFDARADGFVLPAAPSPDRALRSWVPVEVAP